MFYRFMELCKERDVLPADVCKATGISQSIFSNLKARTKMAEEYGNPLPGLSVDNLIKVCRYFNVPLDYFVEER